MCKMLNLFFYPVENILWIQTTLIFFNENGKKNIKVKYIKLPSAIIFIWLPILTFECGFGGLFLCPHHDNLKDIVLPLFVRSCMRIFANLSFFARNISTCTDFF